MVLSKYDDGVKSYLIILGTLVINMDNGPTSGISVMVNDKRLMINVQVVISYEAGVRVI